MIIDEPKHYQKPATSLKSVYILFKHFIAVAGLIDFNASTQFKERGLISSGTNMDDLGMGIWNRYSGSYTINNKPPYDSFIAVVYRSGSYVVQIAYNAANNSQSVRRTYYGGNWTSWQ